MENSSQAIDGSQTLDSSQLIERQKGRSVIVIRREACLYACLDFSVLSNTLKQKSLAIQLKKLSPYPEFDSHVIWISGHAMIWLWKSDIIQSTQESENSTHTSIQVYPETLMIGSRHHSKIELVTLSRGFEGRIWEDGLLKGSRFWPESPDLAKWNLFLRSHSLKPATSQEPAQAYKLNQDPWYKPSTIEQLQTLVSSIHPLWAIGYVFLAVFSFQLAAYFQVSTKLEQIDEQYQQTLQSANQMVTAREQSYQEREIIHQLQTLSPWPMSIELMAVSLQLIKDLNAKMVDWKFDNGELNLIILAQSPDPTQFVTIFESSSYFYDVRINNQTGNGNLALVLKVHPKASLNLFAQDSEPGTQL